MTTAKVTLTVDCADASGAYFTRGSVRIVPSFTRLGDTADSVLIEQAGARVTFPATGGPPTVDLYPCDLIGPQGANAPGWSYNVYYDRECPGNPQPWSFQLLSTDGAFQRLSSLAASPVAETVSLYLLLPSAAPSSVSEVLGLSSLSPLTTAWVNPSAASLPLTTLGDTLAEDGTPTPVRVPGNATATRMFFRQQGTGTASALPAWDTLQAGDIPDLSASYDVAGSAATAQANAEAASVPLTDLPLSLASGGTGAGYASLAALLLALLAAGGGTMGAALSPKVTAIAYAATVTPDSTLGNVGNLTLAGDATVNPPSGGTEGEQYELDIVQDATGGHAVTWGAGWDWGSAGAPAMSTAANARDIVVARYRNGAWRAAAATGFAS